MSAYSVPGFTPDPNLLPRVRQLLLLDFTLHEMGPSLEQAMGVAVPLLEIQDHVTWLQEAWREHPEAEQLMGEQGQAYARGRMLLRDLLSVYQDMLANHKAGVEGLFSHGDGRPVLPVKALEVASMAEKITKLEADLVARRKALVTQMGTAAPSYQPPVMTDDPEMDEDIEVRVSELV